MNERPFNVLFLCTGNSARSILAEQLLNHWGGGRFCGFSAGSRPKGTVHPIALELLQHMKLPTEGLRSKSWNEFAKPGAPPLDFVFTVCDNAAGEVCPYWPGQPMTAHWGVKDPAAVEGSGHGEVARVPQDLQGAREPHQDLHEPADPIARPDQAPRAARSDRSSRTEDPREPRAATPCRGAWARFCSPRPSSAPGIMAERLAAGNGGSRCSPTPGATVAVLGVLITLLAPISGAHFNPAVYARDGAAPRAQRTRGECLYRRATRRMLCRCALLAHAMFELPRVADLDPRAKRLAQWLAEFVATFGLLFIVRGCSSRSESGMAGRGMDRCGLLVYGLDVIRQSRRSRSRVRLRTPLPGYGRSIFRALIAAQLLGAVAGFYACRFLSCLYPPLLTRLPVPIKSSSFERDDDSGALSEDSGSGGAGLNGTGAHGLQGTRPARSHAAPAITIPHQPARGDASQLCCPSTRAVRPLAVPIQKSDTEARYTALPRRSTPHRGGRAWHLLACAFIHRPDLSLSRSRCVDLPAHRTLRL